jgi:hypothetical protein
MRQIVLKWSNILGYSMLPETHIFQLKFTRADCERELNLISVFSEYIYEVFSRIGAERKARAIAKNSQQNGQNGADEEEKEREEENGRNDDEEN